MSEAVIRPFTKDDREFMLEMIIKAWNYAEWIPAGSVRPMGEYYMYQLLSESDAAWIAEIDGRRAGILSVGDRRRRRFRPVYLIRQHMTGLSLRLKREASELFRQFVMTEALDVALLARVESKFDAELTLLITDADFQGRGAGSALYSVFIDWLKRGGMRRFYLFTDSSCDFAFYEMSIGA